MFWSIMARRTKRNSESLIELITLGLTEDAIAALERGVFPSSVDKQGLPALALAISLGNTAIVRKLLDSGADVTTEKPHQREPTSSGTPACTVLRTVQDIFIKVAVFAFLGQLNLQGFVAAVVYLLPISSWTSTLLMGGVVTMSEVCGSIVLAVERYAVFQFGAKHSSGRLQSLFVINWIWSFKLFAFHTVVLFFIIFFNTFLIALVVRAPPKEAKYPGTVALDSLYKYAGNGSEMMKLLLTHGIDLGDPQQVGSPYHRAWIWAVEQGHPDIVRTLIDRGVPPSIHVSDLDDQRLRWQGFNSLPILMHAASHGRLEIVLMLLEHGSDGYAQQHLNHALLECISMHGSSELAEGSACRHIVDVLLDYGANPNIKADDGRSAFSLASCMDDDLSLRLLATGADPSSADSSGRTPLHYAWHVRIDSKIVDILVDAGAPVNALDNMGRTPLWWVASMGVPWTVGELVRRGAKVDFKGPGASTPLMEACKHNGVNMVLSFLEHGADPNASTADDTPLLAALRRNNPSLSPDLIGHLLRAGAKPVLPLSFPRQPLVEVIQCLHTPWLREILKAAKDTREDLEPTLTKALRGLCCYWSPGHVVTEEDFKYRSTRTIEPESAFLLIESGADPAVRYRDGDSVLHAACRVSGTDTIFLESLVDILLQRNVSLETPNDHGRTPLHEAARQGNLVLLKLLLEKGAMVDPLDNKLKTPLHLACGKKPTEWTRYTELVYADLEDNQQFEGVRGRAARIHEENRRWRIRQESVRTEDVVDYLLEYGADPMAKDGIGMTPLHLACHAGNVITAGAVLECRPDYYSRIARKNQTAHLASEMLRVEDAHGRTPQYYAEKSGKNGIVKLVALASDRRKTDQQSYPAL